MRNRRLRREAAQRALLLSHYLNEVGHRTVGQIGAGDIEGEQEALLR